MPDISPSSGDQVAGRGLKQSLIYFGTVVAGQGLSFLLLPFVTRAIDPTEYGNYSLALAVSTLIGMFASAWLRNVAMRLYFEARQQGRTRGFFLGIALTQAVTLSGFYVLVVALLFASGLSPTPIGPLVSAGFTMLVGDLAIFTATLLRAEQQSSAFAVAEIGAGVLRFVATMAGLYLGFTTAEMLFNATSIGLAVAAAFSIAKLLPRLEGPSRIAWVTVGQVVRHGPAALPFSVADWAERLADRVIMEYFWGPALVGVYSIGYTLGERTVGLLINAISMMAWPTIIEAWQDGGVERARAAILAAQRFNLWFTTGPTVFLWVYGADLLRMFAGPEYHSASPLVSIVALSMWMSGFATYLNRHMELQKRFSLLSWTRMLAAAINTILNFVFIPRFGMLGAAYATLASRGFGLVMYWIIRDREVTPSPLRPLLEAVTWSLMCWLVSDLVSAVALQSMLVFVLLYAPAALLALRRTRTG